MIFGIIALKKLTVGVVNVDSLTSKISYVVNVFRNSNKKHDRKWKGLWPYWSYNLNNFCSRDKNKEFKNRLELTALCYEVTDNNEI